MKKSLIAVCMAGGIAVAALAGPGGRGPAGEGFGPGHPPGHGRGLEALVRNPELATKLGIKPEQIAALQAAQYENEKTMIKLRGDFELARLEVRKLVDADSVDKAAVMAAIDNAGKIGTEIRKAEMSQMLKAREILGKDTIAKIREEMRDRRQQRGGDDDEDNDRGDKREHRRHGGPGLGQNDGGAPWMQEEMTPPDEAPEVTAI
jgi:Spy/CpxP family protein refolding chaperone